MNFGVLCAMHAEARTCGRPRHWLDGHEVRIAVSGPGRENAARGAHELIVAGCDALVVWGVAGALEPALRPGDVVLADVIRTERGDEFAIDAALRATWAAHLGRALTVHGGGILTVVNPVLIGREKQRLRHNHEAVIVDMEASVAALVARSAGVPLLCLRSVVDPAAFDVPRAALAGLDRQGHVHPLATLDALWREPRQLPAMLTLFAHYRAALAGLRASARALGAARA